MPVSISVSNTAMEPIDITWHLETRTGEPVASGNTQVDAGAESMVLFSSDLAPGGYHFEAESEDVLNGDFSFDVRQMKIESSFWEANPVHVDETTGVADAVLTGAIFGHEADGGHATVRLVTQGESAALAYGSPVTVTIQPDGTYRHTFVDLEPGTYAPIVSPYKGEGAAYSYEAEYLRVVSDPSIAEAAFAPDQATVCSGEKVRSTLTGKINNWDPSFKVAVEFFEDFDLDADDFAMIESGLEVVVTADGTFSYTIQSVGAGTFSADITVYAGYWENNNWFDIKGFVPFTVTEDEEGCAAPGPGGEDPGGETPGGETPVGRPPVVGPPAVGPRWPPRRSRPPPKLHTRLPSRHLRRPVQTRPACLDCWG